MSCNSFLCGEHNLLRREIRSSSWIHIRNISWKTSFDLKTKGLLFGFFEFHSKWHFNTSITFNTTRNWWRHTFLWLPRGDSTYTLRNAFALERKSASICILDRMCRVSMDAELLFPQKWNINIDLRMKTIKWFTASPPLCSANEPTGIGGKTLIILCCCLCTRHTKQASLQNEKALNNLLS